MNRLVGAAVGAAVGYAWRRTLRPSLELAQKIAECLPVTEGMCIRCGVYPAERDVPIGEVTYSLCGSCERKVA